MRLLSQLNRRAKMQINIKVENHCRNPPIRERIYDSVIGAGSGFLAWFMIELQALRGTVFDDFVAVKSQSAIDPDSIDFATETAPFKR